MAILENILKNLEPYMDIIYLLITIIIAFTIFSIILRIIKGHLLKRVKRKRQIDNVVRFFGLLKFLFAIFLLILVVIAYHGDWGDIGFIAGLLTIALSMALQKPISSVFAWLIIITRKPFSIGDRVTISNIKGDITDISLTHIFLEEVGGTIDGEEKSNRTVILPTSIIFEQEAINGTSFLSSISVFAVSKNSSYSSFGIIVIFSNSKLRIMSNSLELILAFLHINSLYFEISFKE